MARAKYCFRVLSQDPGADPAEAVGLVEAALDACGFELARAPLPHPRGGHLVHADGGGDFQRLEAHLAGCGMFLAM